MNGTGGVAVSRRAFIKAAGLSAMAGAACHAAADNSPPEARFYTKLEKLAVHCALCPRGCVIPAGARGYCRARENRGGRLVSLVYGRPVATNNDPIEKKPFFHVLPGSRSFSIATVGCNMHCKFCQNWDIAQASPEQATGPYRSPSDIAALAKDSGAATVAYTYNEPTIFHEYMVDCARAVRDRGLGNVVVSNGYISEAALRELCPRVSAIKIDLKAFTQGFYEDVCNGELEPVKQTLKRLAGLGTWYEIVVLLIPTLNDGADEVRRLAGWVASELGPDVPLHFTRFHPCYKIHNLPPTPPQTLARARTDAMAEGCRFVYTGNMPGGEGEQTYCPACGATVIERYGFYLKANRLVNGSCYKCGRSIPGVWAQPQTLAVPTG